MLTTAVAILASISLLMPGFIVTEISVARSARSSRSDLEIALRALAYTLVIHLAASPWTAHLVRVMGSFDNWPDHVGALAFYVGVVLLGVPVALGVFLNVFLARAEQRDGMPRLVAAALGAGEARDAFDYAFQRLRRRGGYVIVELVGHTPEAPRLIGGLYGRGSAVGQTPSPHDLYLQELFTVREDENGVRDLVGRLSPPRGLYVPGSQIVRLELLAASGESSGPREHVGLASERGVGLKRWKHAFRKGH